MAWQNATEQTAFQQPNTRIHHACKLGRSRPPTTLKQNPSCKDNIFRYDERAQIYPKYPFKERNGHRIGKPIFSTDSHTFSWSTQFEYGVQICISKMDKPATEVFTARHQQSLNSFTCDLISKHPHFCHLISWWFRLVNSTNASAHF